MLVRERPAVLPQHNSRALTAGVGPLALTRQVMTNPLKRGRAGRRAAVLRHSPRVAPMGSTFSLAVSTPPMPPIPAPHASATARAASLDLADDWAAVGQVRRLHAELAGQSQAVRSSHLDAMQRSVPQVPVCRTTPLEDSIRAIVSERAQLHYFSEISHLALQQFDRLETLTADVLAALLDPSRPFPSTIPAGSFVAELTSADLVPEMTLSAQTATQQRSRLVCFYERMRAQTASVEADFLSIAERLGTLSAMRLSASDFATGVTQAIEGVDWGRDHVGQLAEAHRLAACRLSQLEADARRLVCQERVVVQSYGDLA